MSFYVTAQSTNGLTWSWPEGGASAACTATVALGELISVNNDMEAGQGWVSGFAGDDATTGIWTRGDPIGTGSQPEDDHTAAPGTDCWFTGQGSIGGSLGENDIDNGVTTLVSPFFNMSGLANPTVSYWRWYSNNGNGVVDDVFEIQISNGGPWVNVEVLGPSGPGTGGGWIYHQFKVADFVTPNATVRMRFRAADVGSGSIVEAAIDDFQVKEIDCTGSAPMVYCTPKVTSDLCVPAIGFSGTPSTSDPNPFDISATQISDNNNGLLFYGFGSNSNPFQGGTLCVAPPVTRTPGQNSGGAATCSGTFSFDFNARIQSGIDPSLTAGATVYGQYWFRDTGDPFGSGLSDGLQFQIQS